MNILEGKKIPYKAYLGRMFDHAQDWEDTAIPHSKVLASVLATCSEHARGPRELEQLFAVAKRSLKLIRR